MMCYGVALLHVLVVVSLFVDMVAHGNECAVHSSVEWPPCIEAPLHLLPEGIAASGLFNCQSPDGPVAYTKALEWVHDDCAAFNSTDFLLFTAASHRQRLPFLFASLISFVRCWNSFHLVVPAHEQDAIMLFIPSLPKLQIHLLIFPVEICEWMQEDQPDADAGVGDEGLCICSHDIVQCISIMQIRRMYDAAFMIHSPTPGCPSFSARKSSYAHSPISTLLASLVVVR